MTRAIGRALLCWGLLAALAQADPAGPAGGEGESLRRAKALFFDRQYAEARTAWQAIQAATGSDAEAAAYWVARCSENLGEHERALAEYAAFLERRPGDAALAEEARTSRVGLGARLFKAGKKDHLPLLLDGLRDPSRTVRYFAALQLGGLGPPVGAAAVPVLKRILADEKDADLVDRAKLALLRLDPGALREAPAQPGASQASWVRLRIYQKGVAKPTLAMNLPVALAEMLFKSLPDQARKDLKREGYDAASFWEKLRRLGPTQILDIEGEDGERIRIWIE
jgi:hypothetical protein